MTRPAAILLFILTSCFISFAQVQLPFKNDLKRQNLKGRVTTVTENEYDAKKDSLRWKSIAKYNEQGNEVEFNTYAPSGQLLSKTTFKYDDTGKMIEEKRYKADGTLNVRTTCKYDFKGNKIEESNYDPSEVLFMKIVGTFNGKGQRIVKDSYNEFGSLFLKANSKFDDDGNEISMKEYDSHKSLKFSTTFDYENADAEGNWLKRTMYKNDDPVTVTTREIEYR